MNQAKCARDALLCPGPQLHGSPLMAAGAPSHMASLPRGAADIPCSINTTAQPPCRAACAAQAMPCCWQGTHKRKGSCTLVFLMPVAACRRKGAHLVGEGTREMGASLGACTEGKSPEQRGQGTITEKAHTVALRLGSSLAKQ